jgi:hypothetical protein
MAKRKNYTKLALQIISNEGDIPLSGIARKVKTASLSTLVSNLKSRGLIVAKGDKPYRYRITASGRKALANAGVNLRAG